MSGEVRLAAAHTRVQEHTVEERLEVWSEPPPQPVDAISVSRPGAKSDAEAESTRDAVVRLLLEKLFSLSLRMRGETSPAEPPTTSDESSLSLRQRGEGRGEGPNSAQTRGSPPALSGQPAQPTLKASLDRVERHVDAEQLKVAAAGHVTTRDGRELELSYVLEQARQQVTTTATHRGDTKKVDPLALDLDGAGVKLSATKTDFDLDGDGTTERISTLAGGDAWLARDLDGNGRIDDGRELFGPGTGDGFAELAALDTDADGFLDEDDAAFDSLLLWRGDGALSTLRQAGVGALALARVTSPFQLDGGETRETGVYLTEQGTAGALQHVDLEV